MSMLRKKGIGVFEDMDGPLRPGSVVFVETGDGITHRDYVTRAWTRDPLKDVLVKMSAPPSPPLPRAAPHPTHPHGAVRAFSSEVDTGSREENASNQESNDIAPAGIWLRCLQF